MRRSASDRTSYKGLPTAHVQTWRQREARKYLIAQGYEEPRYIIFPCGDILDNGRLVEQEGNGVVLYSLLWRLRDGLAGLRFRRSGRFALLVVLTLAVRLPGISQICRQYDSWA